MAKPLHIGGPLGGAYVRDLTSERARLRLTGEDRVRFLHGMVTNDIEALTPGRGCRAVMLTVKGKTLAELSVYCAETSIDLELDGRLGEAIRGVIEKHVIMDDVEVAPWDTRETGVWGDDARARIEAALGAQIPALDPWAFVELKGVRVAATPELAMPGYLVFGDLRIEGETLDDAAYETLRIEAGRPRWGAELDADRLVLEANMDDAVSLTKGCYLGQEVVARATARGHINRRLMGLRLEGAAAAQPGAKLSGPGRDDAGHVTSSVVSPRFGAIALAYVHRSLFDEGTELVVHDPSGDRKARVTSLPFRAT